MPNLKELLFAWWYRREVKKQDKKIIVGHDKTLLKRIKTLVGMWRRKKEISAEQIIFSLLNAIDERFDTAFHEHLTNLERKWSEYKFDEQIKDL